MKIPILLVLLMVLPSMGQDSTRYFYYHPGQDYGTESVFNPGTVILNGTFDILRNGAHSKLLLEQPYELGMRNVWNNITHPIANIRQYGWKPFISEEIFPLHLNKNQVRYLPNYMHHVLGSGMLYAKMAEWYDAHGTPYPHVASALTSYVYHFMNEALENGSYQGSNTDPIADLLIFDPLGIIVFSFNAVNRFFSKDVLLEDWSLQPVYNPWSGKLDNAGQQFVLKYKLPWFEQWSVFTYWGINGISGLSYSAKNGLNYSFGIGKVVNRLNPKLLRNSRYVTPDLDGALGFFIDRKQALLTSVIISGPRLYNIRINTFPGLFSIGPFKPGLYVGFGEWDHFIFGISLAHFPMGISVGGKY